MYCTNDLNVRLLARKKNPTKFRVEFFFFVFYLYQTNNYILHMCADGHQYFILFQFLFELICNWKTFIFTVNTEIDWCRTITTAYWYMCGVTSVRRYGYFSTFCKFVNISVDLVWSNAITQILRHLIKLLLR